MSDGHFESRVAIAALVVVAAEESFLLVRVE